MRNSGNYIFDYAYSFFRKDIGKSKTDFADGQTEGQNRYFSIEWGQLINNKLFV